MTSLDRPYPPALTGPRPAGGGPASRPVVRRVPPVLEIHPGFGLARRPVIAPPPPARRRLAAAVAIGLIAAVALFSYLALREPPAVAAWSAGASTDGLAIRDVRAVRTTSAGWPLLTIEGAIDNLTGDAIAVPVVRLGVRGLDGAVTRLDTVEPAQRWLGPGARTTFMAEIPDTVGTGQVIVGFEPR